MSHQTTVVIVNWNGAKFLPALLESLYSENPAEIVVVDNASSDGSCDYLKTQKGIRLITNQENVGFGCASNQGIQLVLTPYILLLNVDTQALPGSIGILEGFLQSNSRAAIVAPKLVFPDGRLQKSCRRFPTLLTYSLFLSNIDYLVPTGYRISKRKHEHLMQVDQPMGAVLMIRRSTLDEIGLFDSQFSLYMEEIDLCKRIKDRGWQIYYLPEARFIHHAGGSTSQDWERSQTEYFKNVIRYFAKHFPQKNPNSVGISLSVALIIRSFVCLFRGKLRQTRFYLRMSSKLIQLRSGSFFL